LLRGRRFLLAFFGALDFGAADAEVELDCRAAAEDAVPSQRVHASAKDAAIGSHFIRFAPLN
jgi:hypothetical protein